MFYDENQSIEMCENDPATIFNFIDAGQKEMVEKLITKKIIDVNQTNNNGTDVITYLLKNNWYDLVLKAMKIKTWNINHQDKEGNTFAHYLVMKNYLEVMDIIKQLLKNQEFIPNIRNNKGETILDKSINNNYIYTTVKILGDDRFNDIDLVSFKNLYESYVKNSKYGSYSKVNNLEVIISNLSEKELLPKLQKIIDIIKKNIGSILEDIKNNETSILDELIYGALKENI